jgi:hypothetical protein
LSPPVTIKKKMKVIYLMVEKVTSEGLMSRLA